MFSRNFQLFTILKHCFTRDKCRHNGRHRNHGASRYLYSTTLPTLIAKPKAKTYKLFDGGGLFLVVTPVGGKFWRLAYRFNGKPQTISFGAYPLISLAEARKKRDESKATLLGGGSVKRERKARRTQL
ncbi:MAG: Arm DNA-binding domain-containing protein [Burkholderiaceae bacterium]|jgi:hypothetical protein|nr:Arm DNA-binding domain-containing protein [Burkholderiaceae bacterium]